jgi:hypothetical protein
MNFKKLYFFYKIVVVIKICQQKPTKEFHYYYQLVTEPGPAIGGRRRLHGMGQKLFTMSKMFRSYHDIVMWANVHPLCLYTSTSFHFANSASIPIDSSSKTPSFSSVSELLSLGLSIHLTYIGKSLNRSKS